MWGRDTVGGRGGLMSECGWIWRTSRRLKARKTKRAAGKEGSNAGALVCRGNRGSRIVCAAVWLCAVQEYRSREWTSEVEAGAVEVRGEEAVLAVLVTDFATAGSLPSDAQTIIRALSVHGMRTLEYQS